MDKVKAKIQKLCPDVMELKFGCEVDETKHNETKKEWTIISKHTRILDDEVQFLSWLVFDENGIADKQFDSSFEILGSPITLAIVLRAIHKAHKYLAVGNTGQFMDASLPIPDELPFWNLEHDNYDQQSEECKQFIGSLLGV